MKIERTDMDRDMRKLTISQEQYMETILERHGMADCKPTKTLMCYESPKKGVNSCMFEYLIYNIKLYNGVKI